MKKLLILISGRLKYLSDENFLRIKECFKNYEINFILTPWITENETIIKKFEEKYNPLFIKRILQTKHDNQIKKIKFPDYAGSMEGFFYNWEGVCKGFSEIANYCNENNFYPDYILRYRSDILPQKNSVFSIEKNLNYNQIIIPDRFHWNGINDQIFLTTFKTIKHFEFFFNYVDSHIMQNRFFSSEYIFYKFLKKVNLIPVFNNFNYNLMREKYFNKDMLHEPLKSKIPLRDQLEIKLNRFKYKMRNFNEVFILKNKRNKYQDIKID